MLNTQEVSREGRDRERDLWFVYRTIDGSCWPIAETLCSSEEAPSH